MNQKQSRTFIYLCILLVCIHLSEEQGASYGYEGAIRSAVKLTSNISPDTSRTVAEVQAISWYLSPPFSAYGSSPLYTGCQDAYTKGARESGVYPILRNGVYFRAWCDFDASGGWMIIQRRVDGLVDFFKRYAEYEQGFGNLWGEHWLGLNKIYAMTLSSVPLSIYLEAFDGTSWTLSYTSFSVSSSATKYTLAVSGYSGPIGGDSFSSHSGYKFSAWDQDNDIYSSNCAQLFYGGWWYSNCHSANLNGRYERGATTSYATSNCWSAFKGYNYGLKVSVMKIKV